MNDAEIKKLRGGGGLALTRYATPGKNEIIIDDRLLVQVSWIAGKKVKLRFLTNHPIPIDREEVYERTED